MLGRLKSTKLHFIGIGGIGMSAIAEILLDLGHIVSGSDVASSSVTDHLIKKGAKIFIGHRGDQIEGSSIVIYSSAIQKSNPEMIRAHELNIPMIQRAEMLAELMRLKIGIAVAGSHGKTTTTSLLATIFQEAHLDATHIIGGIVHNLGGNARKGDGEYLIAEADESDGSFLYLNPIIAAVTNIDNDHLDHYGSQEKIVDAFIDFVNKLPFYGRVALNADDPVSFSIRQKIKRPMVWYSVNESEGAADYRAQKIHYDATGTTFELFYDEKLCSVIKIPIWGKHNVSNSLAAIAISHQVGIDIGTIQKGLLNFQGVARRMERLFVDKDLVVIDDYGHHPTEIRATLSSIREVDTRKMCVVFEPHRYSRTQNFWNEFQNSFNAADEVFISPIYAASEAPIKGITAEALVDEMRKIHPNTHFLADLSLMKKLIHERRNANSLFITLGAGSISKKIREIIKDL